MKNRVFLNFIGRAGKARDLLSECLLLLQTMALVYSVIVKLNLTLLHAKWEIKYLCHTLLTNDKII